MELAGKVVAILEPRSGVAKSTGNPWMTQDYVIETHEQFPRKMVFNVYGEDKIRQFNLKLGEEVNVFFDINAREWQGRWFNDIRAWRIDRVAETAGDIPVAGSTVAPAPMSAAPTPAAPAAPIAEATPFEQGDNNDDLPF